MFDMMGMMGKVKEMQARMKEAQDRIGDVTAEGESGAGMVKATVNGKKQLISLEIDPTLLKPEDARMLNDLVVAAVNKALENVEVLAQNEISKATEGLMPKIPGMDLGSLFGK